MAGSGGKRAPEPPRADEQLFLGQWLARLKMKQSDLATRAGLSKSYIHNMISPPNPDKPKEPSVIKMLRISRAMGITINDLYSEPPTKAQVEAMRSMPAHIAARLIETDTGLH